MAFFKEIWPKNKINRQKKRVFYGCRRRCGALWGFTLAAGVGADSPPSVCLVFFPKVCQPAQIYRTSDCQSRLYANNINLSTDFSTSNSNLASKRKRLRGKAVCYCVISTRPNCKNEKDMINLDFNQEENDYLQITRY